MAPCPASDPEERRTPKRTESEAARGNREFTRKLVAEVRERDEAERARRSKDPLPPPPAAIEPDRPARIRLPRTSTRLQGPDVYVSIVERVLPERFGSATFEPRKIYRPGAVVDLEALPQPCVAIECTGRIGPWQRNVKRDSGYILWSYDFERGEWKELARAQGRGIEWTMALREPALRALHPRPELVDLIGRSEDLAEELIGAIEQRLVPERAEVRKLALNLLYQRVVGRIAECA